ncbi:hypothetical protein [Acuticoccus sp.]|uniref:hypothetical protein n=1 Tax=Acuticoccus sp. TaxID=1904378 RepID=UPI003B5169BB
MRAFVTFFACVLLATGSASVVHAADLGFDHYTGKPYGAPRHFGRYEPWSVREERPPRKGYWYFTQPVTPTVNFLLPLNRRPTVKPYTPAWYAYCEARWDTFNPRTGTVVTPNGVRMCF